MINLPCIEMEIEKDSEDPEEMIVVLRASLANWNDIEFPGQITRDVMNYMHSLQTWNNDRRRKETTKPVGGG